MPADYEMPVTVDDYEGRQLRRDGSRSLAHRQEAIDKGLALLDEQLDRAASLLTPVLGPERPSPALQGSQPGDAPGSELGLALDSYSRRLGVLTGRLSYLCDRIDL